MFRGLRFRLALWFVLLTALVYISLTWFGMFLFKQGLNTALDQELQALSSEIRPVIDVQHGLPVLPGWTQNMRREPRKLLSTIQLFDNQGKLLEEYGPVANNQLVLGKVDTQIGVHKTRVLTTPLWQGDRQIGYLQIQLPIILRDRSTEQFGHTLFQVLPLLLLALGVSGYVFSGMVIRPIEDSFQVLRRFLADAGHELQTPISIIQINTESMEAELNEAGIKPKNLEVISRATERLNTLVKDLSLLGKMESPQLSFKSAPLQLNKCVIDVVEEFEESFKSKGIRLECVDSQPVTIIGHADSLRRLLTNLLQNALRYTDPGGQVKITISQMGRLAKVTVEDSGIGIPTESLKHIFERFYRVDESRSRAAGGSGLGLSIVKAIAEAHHGKVEVTSEPEKGSRFSITFPIKH